MEKYLIKGMEWEQAMESFAIWEKLFNNVTIIIYSFELPLKLDTAEQQIWQGSWMHQNGLNLVNKESTYILPFIGIWRASELGMFAIVKGYFKAYTV